MVAAVRNPMRSTCLIGGVPAFAAQLRPKLARYGLSVDLHFEEGRPPRDLPPGYEVYLVFHEVTHHAQRNMVGWKEQASREHLVLVALLRKEAFWASELGRVGIHKLGPVAGAALANEQAGEETPMAGATLSIQEKKLPPVDRRKLLLDQLKATIDELRDNHGLSTLMMDETGKVSMEILVRESISL